MKPWLASVFLALTAVSGAYDSYGWEFVTKYEGTNVANKELSTVSACEDYCDGMGYDAYRGMNNCNSFARCPRSTSSAGWVCHFKDKKLYGSETTKRAHWCTTYFRVSAPTSYPTYKAPTPYPTFFVPSPPSYDWNGGNSWTPNSTTEDEKDESTFVFASLGFGAALFCPVLICCVVRNNASSQQQGQAVKTEIVQLEARSQNQTKWEKRFTNDGRAYYADRVNKVTRWDTPPDLAAPHDAPPAGYAKPPSSPSLVVVVDRAWGDEGGAPPTSSNIRIHVITFPSDLFFEGTPGFGIHTDPTKKTGCFIQYVTKESGLKHGDEIISLNGESLEGRNTEDYRHLFKNPELPATIILKRRGESTPAANKQPQERATAVQGEVPSGTPIDDEGVPSAPPVAIGEEPDLPPPSYLPPPYSPDAKDISAPNS